MPLWAKVFQDLKALEADSVAVLVPVKCLVPVGKKVQKEAAEARVDVVAHEVFRRESLLVGKSLQKAVNRVGKASGLIDVPQVFIQ